jgi:molybdate transport system substrate-binding protein
MCLSIRSLYILSGLLITMLLVGCGQGGAAATQNTGGKQVVIEVFHADSLAGPMAELKKVFEAKNAGLKVNLTSGRSKELSDRILSGDSCDVFAPSDPQVVKTMIGKTVGGKEAAGWYITFSANELVVITSKGNPLGLKQISDLARDGVKLARVTGEKDMATTRTLEFIKKAVEAEGNPELAQKIIDRALKAATIPEVLQAVTNGKANTGIVYLSAAVTVANDADIVYFPAKINLSENIRNVVTVPGTAKNAEAAGTFIKFILSAEGQEILRKTGQPPIVPPIKEGSVPASILS